MLLKYGVLSTKSSEKYQRKMSLLTKDVKTEREKILNKERNRKEEQDLKSTERNNMNKSVNEKE